MARITTLQDRVTTDQMSRQGVYCLADRLRGGMGNPDCAEVATASAARWAQRIGLEDGPPGHWCFEFLSSSAP